METNPAYYNHSRGSDYKSITIHIHTIVESQYSYNPEVLTDLYYSFIPRPTCFINSHHRRSGSEGSRRCCKSVCKRLVFCCRRKKISADLSAVGGEEYLVVLPLLSVQDIYIGTCRSTDGKNGLVADIFNSLARVDKFICSEDNIGVIVVLVN